MATACGFLALAGCSSLSSGDCSVGKQLAAPGGGAACADAKKQRATLFSGDDFPRLWTGEAARTKPNVDGSKLDGPPGAQSDGPAAIGYVGPLRVDYPVQAEAMATDIADVNAAGAKNFNPDTRIAVNFDHATMGFFLKQMLGGALDVNYVAPDHLKGSVTFRTEQPLPKGQVLQVVRDILSRNGLAMEFMNGVYEVGVPSALSAMAATGRMGDAQTMRVVPVRRGSALQVASLVRQLVPSDVALVPTSSDNSIILHASVGDLNMAAELIKEISADGVGENKMAIIPVHEAPPEKVAAELTAFYRERLGKSADLTVIPLESQQAILVGTRDVRLMAGLRALVERLDRDTSAARGLRIIQLTYLSAKDIVPQLSALFGGGAGASPSFAPPPSKHARSSNPDLSGGGSPYGGLSPGGGGGSAGASGGSSAGPMLPQVPSGTGGAPGFSVSQHLTEPPSSQGGGGAGGGGGGEGAGGFVSAGGDGGGGGAGIKFVADTRNNAVMVYSSYDIFKRVRQVLRTLDVPQAQVVIEGTIAEVTLNDNLQYGVQWYLQDHGFTMRSNQGSPPSSSGSSSGFASFGASLGSVQANVVLNALQSITKVKVISSPYLTVVNGKEARLVIGDQIPYAQTTQSSSTNGTVTVTSAIQTLATGIILDVTPKIRSNNSVDLSIDQEVTTPDNSILNGNTQPIISTRSIKSNVIVQSGRTILLGGMIQESTNKVQSGLPIAQTLPIIGNLFKTNNDTSARTELLVMITPRVVRESGQLENITRLLRDQMHVR